MTPAREALAFDLTEEVGREYAAVVGLAAGLRHRSQNLTPAAKKTALTRVTGMEMALQTLFRLAHPEERDVDARVRKDLKRWAQAIEEDAPFEAAIDRI